MLRTESVAYRRSGDVFSSYKKDTTSGIATKWVNIELPAACGLEFID